MKFCKKIPIRVWIVLLIFLCCFLMTCVTMNAQTCSKKMIKRSQIVRYKSWCHLTDDEKKATINDIRFKVFWYNKTVKDYGPRYQWTEKNLEWTRNALYIGSIFASIPGGILAEFIGPYYVLLYTTFMAAVLNGLRVLFVSIHWKVLWASEFLLGIHLGITFPALILWAARWAPPNERGIFVTAWTGAELAISISRIFTRLAAPIIGWRGIFLSLSGLMLMYLIILWLLGCNNPEEHSRITAKEVYYIKRAQRGRATSTRSSPPIGRIFTSRAFWSLNILYFGYICAFYMFLYAVSHFLFTFQGLLKSTVEYMEVVPNIGFVTIAIASCLIADFIRIKDIVSDTNLVRIYTIFSHFVPGGILLFMGMASCDQTISIPLLLVGCAALGCGVLTCNRTIIDISPNYAGTVYGMINVFSSLITFTMPRLESYLLAFLNGVIGWTILFLVGGGCVIGTGVIFMFFGDSTGQRWNLKSQDEFTLYYFKKPKGQPGEISEVEEEEEEEKQELASTLEQPTAPQVRFPGEDDENQGPSTSQNRAKRRPKMVNMGSFVRPIPIESYRCLKEKWEKAKEKIKNSLPIRKK